MNKKAITYQLVRDGTHYGVWGNTKEEVIQQARKKLHRPWWFLRLHGWHVGFSWKYQPWVQI